MEPGIRLQGSDFSKQPGTNASQGSFAATIPRPRVCRHGCRKTVRSRSQGRRPARVPMRQEVEFRFFEGRSDRRERTGPALLQGGGVAIGFGGLDARDIGTIEPIPSKPINLDAIDTAHRIQRAQSARRSRLRIGGSGPARSTCPNNLAS